MSAAQQFATEEDFLAYALSRRLATSSSDPEASVVLWARSLAVLEDVRALPLLLDVIDQALDGPRSWEAVDVALDGIVALGRSVAITTLTRLMSHPEVQMRFRAVEKLVTVDGAERWLCHRILGHPPDERVVAVWGLVRLGRDATAKLHLRSHAALLVPRFVALGPRGIRMLCGYDHGWLGDRLDYAASVLARKRQHYALLEEFASGGSVLAALALDRMIGQRPRRRCRIPAFGEEPLTRAELRDLEEAGADLDIVRRAQTSLELFEDETPRKGRKQSAT